jgi:hypothetical protein
MQNRSLSPTPWARVALAVLPGLLAVGLRSGLFRGILGWRVQRALEQNDLIPVYIALGVVVAGLIVERRLAIWSFPALGMLLLVIPGWVITPFTLLGDSRSRFWLVAPSYLALAVLAAPAALAVHRVYKQHGVPIPRLGWLLLGLMILFGLAGAIVGATTDRNPDKWMALVAHLPLEAGWAGLLLVPIVIGLPLAQRNGLLAGLVLVAFEFVLLDEIFDPTYSVRFWAHWEPGGILGRAKIALSYLPALFFLVVTPIWVYRSRSTRGRVLGLLLPPFVALICTDVIVGIALQGTSGEYAIGSWLTHGVSTAQLWMPLALAAVTYHWLGRWGPTGCRSAPVLADNVA